MRTALAVAALLTQGVFAQTPLVRTVLPPDNATGVALNARILIAFHLNPASATVRLTRNGVALSGTQARPPLGSDWLTFTPDRAMEPQSVYDLRIDYPGRPAVTSRFTTGSERDTVPARLLSVEPAAGQDGVNAADPIKLRFSKPLDPATLPAGRMTLLSVTAGHAINVANRFLLDDAVTLQFTPGFDWATAYRFDYSFDGFVDAFGNPLAPAPGSIAFSTFVQPPKDGPILVGSAPEDGEADVPTNFHLYFRFEKPLAASVPGDAVSIEPPMIFRTELSTDRRGLKIIPSALWAPNREYTVRLAMLMDAFGVATVSPITVAFRTAALPDLRNFQPAAPSYGNASFPSNAQVPVRFTRPLNPLLLTPESVQTGPPFSSAVQKVGYRLSADRMAIVLDLSTLPPGFYDEIAASVFDRVESRPTGARLRDITIRAESDAAPPRLIASNPPDGGSSFPPSRTIEITFDEIAVPGPDRVFRLLRGGQPVDGEFPETLSGLQYSFRPRTQLEAGAEYRLEVSGFTDLAGNVMEPFGATFRTGANSSGDPFRVVSTVPEANATGVDLATAVAITFNRDVDPVSVIGQQAVTLNDGTRLGGRVDAAVRVEGSRVILEPKALLRPGARYSVSQLGVRDYAGSRAANSFLSFVTASEGEPDRTPPEVISVSPGDGAVAWHRRAVVAFLFSEPLSAASWSPDNFLVFAGGERITSVSLSSIGDRLLSVAFDGRPDTLFTVQIGSGVTDLGGNALAPFRTTVRTGPEETRSAAAQALLAGYAHLPNVDSAVKVLFTAPVDRESVERGLIVSLSGRRVEGAVVWTPDSQGFTFVPTAPLTAGSLRVIIGPPARDLGGSLLSASLDGGSLLFPTEPPDLAIIGSSAAYEYLDSVFDFLVNRDVTPEMLRQFRYEIARSDTGAVLPVETTNPRPRVIRVRSLQPREPSTAYRTSLEFAGVKGNGHFTTGTLRAPEAAIDEALPALSAGPVPLNTRVGFTYTGKINSLTLANGVRLRTGDRAVAATRLDSDGRTSLIPHRLLAPDTEYSVAIEGLEDAAGRPIPGRSWTFRTGSTVDIRTPKFLFAEPSGESVSPVSPISIVFDEPMWSLSILVQDTTTNLYLPGRTRLGEDHRTAFFVPDRPLGAGRRYQISFHSAEDLAGNRLAPGQSAQVAFGYRPATVPRVIASAPKDGADGLPVNVRLQVRFDQPVRPSSLSGVRLLSAGAPLRGRVRLEADGSTVTLLPEALLSPYTAYEIVVTGVRSTDDKPMEGEFRSTFRTALDADTVAPLARLSVPQGALEVPPEAPLRIRFFEPMNRLSASAGAVRIQRLPDAPNLALRLEWEDDDRTVRVVPEIPLAPRSLYQFWMNGVSDAAGNPAPDVFTSFTTGDGTAGAPLTAILNPPDGASGVPFHAQIVAAMSGPFAIVERADFLRLYRGDTPVAGRVDLSPWIDATLRHVARFIPSQALDPGAAYRVELSGVAGADGKLLPPLASTFTTSEALTGDFSVPSIRGFEPASGSVGVPVTAQIRITASKPLSPATTQSLTVTVAAAPVPGRWTIEGATATFTAAPQLPAASRIVVSGSFYDLALNRNTISFLFFETAAGGDMIAPTLDLVHPADGSVLPAGPNHVQLRFSEPILIRAGADPFRVFAGSAPVAPSFSRAEDGRTFVANLDLPPSSEVTVSIDSGATDFAGNGIAPVRIRYRTLAQEDSGLPRVISFSPPAGATNVPADTPIRLRFSRPMAGSSLQAAFHATTGGAPVQGELGLAENARDLRFTPSAPYATGSLVTASVESFAHDLTGATILPFVTSFWVAGPAAGAQAIPVSMSASAHSIDLKFDRPVTPDSVALALRLERTRVSSRVEAGGADWLRIIPADPLAAGATYHLSVDRWIDVPVYVPFEAGEEAPEMETAQAQDGSILLRFNRPVNPLTIDRARVRLSAQGQPAGYAIQVNLDGTEAKLIPHSAAGKLRVDVSDIESRGGARMRRQAPR